MSWSGPDFRKDAADLLAALERIRVDAKKGERHTEILGKQLAAVTKALRAAYMKNS